MDKELLDQAVDVVKKAFGDAEGMFGPAAMAEIQELDRKNVDDLQLYVNSGRPDTQNAIKYLEKVDSFYRCLYRHSGALKDREEIRPEYDRKCEAIRVVIDLIYTMEAMSDDEAVRLIRLRRPS